MTIERKCFDDASAAMSFLEGLSYKNEGFIFRGHSQETYTLQTSFRRYTPIPEESWMGRIGDLIEEFRAGLAKIGKVPFPGSDRQDWMEYARHYGVPTPALDFSYSPYVALFFAFDGRRGQALENVVVYAVNVDRLAFRYARWRHDPGAKGFNDAFQSFRSPSEDFFKDGFPLNTLQFLPLPGQHNYRMHRQMGCLLYDTMNYLHTEWDGLDAFIDGFREPPTHGDPASPYPTAYHVEISLHCIKDILQRLELMNITGTSLFLDAAGVARDIANAYNYNAKTNRLRGTGFGPSHE